MTELSEIVAATEAAHNQSLPALLATVVRVQGSAYRRPGARMLLTTQGGWQAGCISGGCLESDIIRKAWWRTEGGRSVVVTYDSTVEEDAASFDDPLSWGLGLGCNGIVHVLLERLTPGDPSCPVRFVGECLTRRHLGVVATIIASETPSVIGQRVLWHQDEQTHSACTVANAGLAAQIADAARAAFAAEGRAQMLQLESTDVLIETIRPATSLLICGANHDAAPLARMAKSVGWQVTVVDPWVGAPPRPERFPGAEMVLCCAPQELSDRIAVEDGTFAVVMSHNLAHDAGFLTALLPLPLAYIGVLGPRRRTERLLHALQDEGIACSPNDARIHGPIGLDIGADDPENIALSILAEMQAVKAARSGGFLRERPLPIHDSAVPALPKRHLSRRLSATRKPGNAV